MTDQDPEKQVADALAAARRLERAERDESVADELEQTDRLVDSIDSTKSDDNE